MPPEPLPILSYATPVKRSYAHLRALPIYTLGLAAGIALAWIWTFAYPDFCFDPPSDRAVFAASLAICLVMESVWALICLLFIAWLGKNPRVRRTSLRIFLIGLCMPVIFMLTLSLLGTMSTIYPNNLWTQVLGILTSLLLLPIPFAAPFFLICRESRPTTPIDPRKRRRTLTILTVCLLIFPAAMWMWYQLQIYAMERMCGQIAASMRSQLVPDQTRDLPLNYGDLVSEYGSRTATLLSSGPVLLRWQNFGSPWNPYEDRYMIYLDAPLLPSQITRDDSGRDVISITGMPNHYVVTQYSPHLFKIAIPAP